MIPDALCGCCFFQARASIVRKRATHPTQLTTIEEKEMECFGASPSMLLQD